jgi:ATP-dependent RNA helicase DeaD
MLIFVRTKNSTVDLAEKLEARGYTVAALNGDIAQNQRERTIQQLKKGKLDILVATDVAARGLDVERISHVLNYDVPHDTESYVHRIGRTGRAGREGDAILFVAPRERRMLAAIERATRKKIEIMDLPSTELINDKRVAKFKQRITDTLANEDLGLFTQMIEQYTQEHNVPAEDVAAALAQLMQGDTPFFIQNKPVRKSSQNRSREDWDRDDRSRNERPSRGRQGDRKPRDAGRRPARKDSPREQGMDRFRIEVGHNHQVMPGNIVGAIANEAGMDSKHIGRINIHDDYSLVDLPEGMPKEVFTLLKDVWVAGQQLKISRFSDDASAGSAPGRDGGSRPAKKGKDKKPPKKRKKSKTTKKVKKKKPGKKKARKR